MERVPRSSSSDLFAAPNEVVWKPLMLKEQLQNSLVYCSSVMPTHLSVNSRLSAEMLCLSFPDVTSEFGLCGMLETIAAIASDNHEIAGDRFHTAERCRQLLFSWLAKYRLHILFEKRKSVLMTLWHSIFMSLHADFYALDSCRDQKAHTVLPRNQPYAKAWARSIDARRCLLHCLLVQKHIEHLPLGIEPPIHAPLSLYNCGLTWFCYLRFGGRESLQDWEEDLDFPEMRLLGEDPKKMFREQIEPELRKPPSGPVVKIIDLLQRMTHWKLAYHLASNLLALVEPGQGDPF